MFAPQKQKSCYLENDERAILTLKFFFLRINFFLRLKFYNRVHNTCVTFFNLLCSPHIVHHQVTLFFFPYPIERKIMESPKKKLC